MYAVHPKWQVNRNNDDQPFLVGGFKHFLFSITYGIIVPIFQDG